MKNIEIYDLEDCKTSIKMVYTVAQPEVKMGS